MQPTNKMRRVSEHLSLSHGVCVLRSLLHSSMGQARTKVHRGKMRELHGVRMGSRWGCCFGVNPNRVIASSSHMQPVQLNFKEAVHQMLDKHLCRSQSPSLGPTCQGLALSGWLTCLANHSTWLCVQHGPASRVSSASTCVDAVWAQLPHSVQGANSESSSVLSDVVTVSTFAARCLEAHCNAARRHLSPATTIGTVSMMGQPSLAPLATTHYHNAQWWNARRTRKMSSPTLSPKTKKTSILKTSQIAKATPHSSTQMKLPSWDSMRSHGSKTRSLRGLSAFVAAVSSHIP